MAASRLSRRRQAYKPAMWERAGAITAAAVVLVLILYLVVRNEPFGDPNLVVLVRIVLSLSVAVLGATIPGFLHVGVSGGGFALRAGGALALFVFTFLLTPEVVSGGNNGRSPPLVPDVRALLADPGTRSSVPIRVVGDDEGVDLDVSTAHFVRLLKQEEFFVAPSDANASLTVRLDGRILSAPRVGHGGLHWAGVDVSMDTRWASNGEAFIAASAAVNDGKPSSERALASAYERAAEELFNAFNERVRSLRTDRSVQTIR